MHLEMTLSYFQGQVSLGIYDNVKAWSSVLTLVEVYSIGNMENKQNKSM